MKLDMFNPWRDLAEYSGLVMQYQTSKKGNIFATYIRDKASGKAITSGHGLDKIKSFENAKQNLAAIGIEGIQQAIKSGQPIHPSRVNQPAKEIDWRDGANHRHRAQRKIVDGN